MPQLVEDAVARCKAGTYGSSSRQDVELCGVWRRSWAESSSYIVAEPASLTLDTLFTLRDRGAEEAVLCYRVMAGVLAACCLWRIKQLTSRVAAPAAGTPPPHPSAELVCRLYSALECSICMDKYQASAHGCTPRQLKCGHSFCESCLNTMMMRTPAGKAGKTLACPSCREETVVAKGNASDLQRNLTVLSLLE